MELLQLVGAAFLVLAAATFGVVASAGATSPTNGSIVTGATVPQAPFTAGIPFSSGQSINVVIPANGVFSPTTNVNIVECSAPGGIVPTDPSTCDGNTINGPTLKPAADGSIDFETATKSLYQIFALPDSVTFGESSGPACDLTDECILYIGDNQNDFTQPHLWSPPFFIAPNSTDDGSDPGDGSPPGVPTTASATLSTVVSIPATATADGVDTSTVTVTLLSSGSLPVPNKTVTLSHGAGHSIITPAATPNVSDVNGQVTFTVTDTKAETVTYSADDTTDNVPLTPTDMTTESVTFAAPVVNSLHSTVTASPTAVATGGATTTITVTLRDQAASPQPVAGKTVTLSGTGSAVIVPAASPNVTNASGVVTFTASDAVAEIVKFTTTDTTDSVTLSANPTVTFGTLTVSPGMSTVTAPSPAAVGLIGTSAVVTLLTSTGSPVAGKLVTLATPTTTSSVGSPVLTNASGQAMFLVTDSVAESVTLSATDTSDGLPITQTAQVVFQIPAPSATASTISPPTSTSPADGQTQTLLTVVIKDQFGNPLSGKTVTLETSPSGNGAQVHPIAVGSSTPGITDINGVAEFESEDQVAETVTFVPNDTTDGFTTTSSAAITYLAGTADANVSTITSAPTQVPSDGSTASTITVTLNDFFGNRVAGKTIALSAQNGASAITPVSPVTSAGGQATFTVTDATAEVVTYTAVDTTDSITLNGQGVVTFGSPPSPPPNASFSSVVANPTSVPADGNTTATITVLLNDGNGDPVAGKTVTLAASGGSSKVMAVSAITGNAGTAMFAVSDAATESVTYTATDTTDNIPIAGDSVVVNFVAPSSSPTGSTTTTTTTPGSSSSGGSGSTDNSGGNGSNGSDGSPSLALTGLPTMLPWLIGFGCLFLAIGTIGRRSARRQNSVVA